MKLVILLIYTPFVSTHLHTFITSYTGVTGIEGIPEFFTVSTLDGQQLDYYDSDTQKLIPKQTWLEEYVSTDMWETDTFIRKMVEQIYKMNIVELMSRFNQSKGIHTYQRMYGCSWDSVTEESDGFDAYGYDGEDFITLDLHNIRYITALPQGVLTMHKWNIDQAQIEFLQEYYKYDCVYWLKYFLNLRQDALKITAPEVSLLQKNPSSVVACHATGFYPSGVKITWMKNEQDYYEDVMLSATLPNVDGTFQKTSELHVSQEDWSKEQFVCVVEHTSVKDTIQKMLSEDEIKSNGKPASIYFVRLSVMMMMMIILIIFVFWLSTVGHNKQERVDFEQPFCHDLLGMCPKPEEVARSQRKNKTLNSLKNE